MKDIWDMVHIVLRGELLIVLKHSCLTPFQDNTYLGRMHFLKKDKKITDVSVNVMKSIALFLEFPSHLQICIFFE